MLAAKAGFGGTSWSVSRGSALKGVRGMSCMPTGLTISSEKCPCRRERSLREGADEGEISGAVELAAKEGCEEDGRRWLGSVGTRREDDRVGIYFSR